MPAPCSPNNTLIYIIIQVGSVGHIEELASIFGEGIVLIYK